MTLVARIKTLREAHTVEAAPERTKRQAASIEEAVTTRIMRGREPVKAEEPKQIDIGIAISPAKTAEIMKFTSPVARKNKSKATHREKVEAEKKQLSLF